MCKGATLAGKRGGDSRGVGARGWCLRVDSSSGWRDLIVRVDIRNIYDMGFSL